MSFDFGMDAGLRALMAARLGLQTAGNNVANANTPGYSRQRLELVSSASFSVAGGFQIGTGVDVAGITRMVDDGLQRRIQLQLGLSGSAEVDQSRFSELEGIFAEPDNGLSRNLSSFFGAINSLNANPADRALRGGMVQAGSQLAQGLNLLSRRFGDLANSSFNEVQGLVQQVNQHAQAIADLNGQIVALEANGSSANDLRDTREQHVQEIGRLLDVNALQRGTGSLDLVTSGHLLVSGSRVSPLSVTRDAQGHTQVMIANGTPLSLGEGRIAALQRQEATELPAMQGRIDNLAYNTILEFNRLQTTGMPGSGPFHSLTSYNGANDGNRNGQNGDELLSQAGFAFPVRNGELWVAVTNQATGAIERSRIAIDPTSMSTRDLATALDGIDHVSASVDPTGHLRMAADAGYGFDFSPRLDPNPNGVGTFGGTKPSVGSAGFGPFDLSGQTFPASITVTTGTTTSPTVTTVTLNASDFADPGAATVPELVTAINNGLAGAGTAVEVGGRLQILSNQGGSTSQLQLADVGAGTVLTALGLSAAPATGQDIGVDVRVEGTYTGSQNGRLTFVPTGDGTIGVTQGLSVDVYDDSGRLVTTKNIGAGYDTGAPIDLGNGVSVKFGAGKVSATAGNAFALDTIANSDSSDVLVALGMNSFFVGSTAGDIAVNPDLVANPDLLATGVSGADGDATNLTRMMNLRDQKISGLDNNKIEDFYSGMVGDLGFRADAANQVLQSQGALLQHLVDQRDSISGVNIDEEMVDMTRYQQSFDAAARFISVVQTLTNSLINIGTTS